MTARKRRGDPRPWLPMAPATPTIPDEAMKELLVQTLLEQTDASEENVRKILDEEQAREVWRNHQYICHVTRRETDNTIEELSIRRADRKPIHDWRHLQQIKNEIAGQETEAFELYPAQSRVVDTANQYFLWCLPPGETIQAGFPEGVLLNAGATDDTAAKQRPLPKEWSIQ